MIQIIIYAGLGKLLIYLAQTFPFQKIVIVGKLWQSNKFLGELFACDLCLGVWIYFFLALLMKVNFFEELCSIPIIFEFFTGASMSFIMHLLTIGWRDKFSTFQIGE